MKRRLSLILRVMKLILRSNNRSFKPVFNERRRRGQGKGLKEAVDPDFVATEAESEQPKTKRMKRMAHRKTNRLKKKYPGTPAVTTVSQPQPKPPPKPHNLPKLTHIPFPLLYLQLNLHTHKPPQHPFPKHHHTKPMMIPLTTFLTHL